MADDTASAAAKLREYPALTAAHFRDARLFSDRSEMLLHLAPRQGLVIGEVGVGIGGFSRFLLETMVPRQFVAFDLFDLHELAELWGRPPADYFGTLSHRAFYETTFGGHRGRMVVEEGPGHERLGAYPDAHFDILYIDADHSYDSVVRDAAVAREKIKPDGLLVFNDYVMMDHTGGVYGVIPAVNEFVVGSDWKVVGFSLQQLMYCDIALRR